MSRHLLLGTIAASACLAEVFAAPKPGLVDRFGSGAHPDMDFSTFLLSACALAPLWQEQALTGLNGTPPEEALPYLRSTGIRMDSAMFAATSGINTHKGLIFALSLLLYGAGRCRSLGKRPLPADVAFEASQPIQGCCERELGGLRRKKDLTNGERIFLEHGLKGVRGEAESGFPTVVNYGIPSYRKALLLGANPNDSALFCLFNLMLHSEDTNIIARKGFHFWKETYPLLVAALLDHSPPYSQEAIRAFRDADSLFSSMGVSPGGAADLLTCTLFLNGCANYPGNICKHIITEV